MTDKKTVEDWINSIDYSVDSSYVPSEFALEFINFIKLVNGEQGEEHKSPVVHYKMLDKITGKKRNVLNMCSRGLSKALALNTPVLTPTGYIPIKDIHTGDIVIDRNGQKTRVQAESEIFNNQTYTVKLTDGTEFIANEDHYHIVQRRTTTGLGKKGKKKNVWKEEELTTKELLKKGVVAKRKITSHTPKGRDLKWFIPLVSQPVEFDSIGSVIDPYTVGVILGDGAVDKISGMPSISAHIADVDELISYIPYNTTNIYHDKRRYETTSFRLKNIGLLVKSFIGTNTTWTKFIPQDLLFGSIQDRIAVLQGLMDTDGTISDSGHYSFTSASKELAEGVKHIVKSLGGYATLIKHSNNYAGYYTVRLNLLDINPFKLKRKANKWQSNKHFKSGVRIGIESIEPTLEIVPSKCISVESETKSFLIDGCLPTRNTTLLGEYLFLYLAVYGSIPGFGQVFLALYVSDSIENGVKNMRKNLEYRWENSDFLKHYIPHTRFTDVRWEFTNIDGKKLIVKGYGAKTGVRGSKEMGQRPTLAVLDDLISDEDARSATVISSIEDTVYKAIKYALHPSKNKIIWSGTPFNSKDPLYKAVESGAWYVNVYPVCETFPCSKEEFRGAWDDRFTYEYVQESYDTALKAGMISTFNQELMLRIMSDEDRLIQDCDISWYRRKTILDNKGLFNFYITTDFATSERSSSDFSVISVWAYNSNGDWLWVDGICKRQLMDKNIEDLFRLAQEYQPQQVGIEVSGQQAGFIQWIQNEMLTRNIYFTLASEGNTNKPGIRPNTNKMERFNIVVPWFKLNRIYFPEERKTSPEITECLEELRLASPAGFKSKHDDFIDTISMLANITAWKPSERQGELIHKDTSNLWDIDIEPDKDYLSSYIV